jgi:hypothetical protein
MNPRIFAASLLVATALSSPCAALAQDTFQAEAGLSYSRFKSDNVRANEAGVDATYYFDKLPTRPDYPFEQVSSSRAASLGANFAGISTDISGLRNQQRIDVRRELRFRQADSLSSPSPLNVLQDGKSRDPATSEEIGDRRAALSAIRGPYVAKTTDVLLTREARRTRSPRPAQPRPARSPRSEFGEHLMRLPGGDYIAFTAGVFRDTLEQQNVPSEKNYDYALQATYYPTHMLGITTGVQFNRGDSLAAGETYTVGARMFFTPAFSVSLDYRRFEAKAANNDADTVALRAALRF